MTGLAPESKPPITDGTLMRGITRFYQSVKGLTTTRFFKEMAFWLKFILVIISSILVFMIYRMSQSVLFVGLFFTLFFITVYFFTRDFKKEGAN
jgi:hypothetical protein